MTEQTGFTPVYGQPAQPVSAEEAAAAARDQLAGQAATAPAPDAGPTLEQIQQAQREAVLPYEQQLAAVMAEMEKLRATVADTQAGVSAARQAAGPPAVELYANGTAALLKAHADANPDMGPEHFAGALATAGELQAAATDAVSSGDVSKVTQLRDEVLAWVHGPHGKHLDFSGLLADLELLGQAVAKLGK